MVDNLSDRQHNYDLLRILSTFAVIIIHVNWLYFKPMYGDAQMAASWVVLSLMNIITRFSVPAFVMLSGAFILSDDKNTDVTGFYKKSLKKIFLPAALVIILLTGVQIVINILKHKGLFYALPGVFKGGFYNLWYIYMLAGLYFLTPYIIRLKKVISWKQYKILTVAMLIWAIISQATSEQKLSYSIGVCFAFLAFYLAGNVLKTEIDRGWQPRKTNLLIICVLCVVITFFWRAMGHNYYISKAYINFFSPTIVLYSLCVFTLFGTIKIRRDCSKLAGITFEIYLFHTVIKRGLAPAIQNTGIVSIIGVFLIGAGTLFISWILALGYKRLWKWIISKNKINELIDVFWIWKWLE